MAFPVSSSPWTGSAPNPAYAGTFIPEIWSGKVIEKFYDATVLGAIANTDYEGEVRNQGDTVKIRTKPTIAISTYEAEQGLTIERPSSNVVDLLVDQGRYFATVLDDVMEVQADLDQMSMWAEDSSEQMKINIDTYVLANILAGISADNVGATAGRISGNIPLGAAAAPLTVVARNPGAGEVEVIDLIVRYGQVLDEQNIPESGRWLILPSWACALIKRSELRDASLTGDGQTMLRNGRLGMIDRFEVYMSNLLPVSTGEYTVFAGHTHGLTFASQLSRIETIRAESTFGTILRGLQVFGHKVIDGTALVGSVISPA
jgi:hypothetical protein